MPETPRGITYPDSSAHTRLWEHFQELALDIDNLLGALPFRMAAGSQSLSASSASNPSTITLPAGRFTQPPIVVATPGSGGSSGNYFLRVYSISTTQFTCDLIFKDVGGTPGAATSLVQWIAVQMSSGSGAG